MSLGLEMPWDHHDGETTCTVCPDQADTTCDGCDAPLCKACARERLGVDGAVHCQGCDASEIETPPSDEDLHVVLDGDDAWPVRRLSDSHHEAA